MVEAVEKLDRYIATSRVASEKRSTVFAFVNSAVRPGDSLTIFALDDDYSFGVLSSSIHRAWFEARCSTFETRLRYTSNTVFDSYPWPQAPSATEVATIAEVVGGLLTLRSKYLDQGASLATVYNTLRQPGRSELRDLHTELDKAVGAAYGFSSDDDVLAQLLALNQDVAADPSVARGPGATGLTGARTSTYRLQA
jgi:hypothetical protein